VLYLYFWAVFYQNLKLGVLGGGQLGRMLLQPCANFDVTTHIMDPNPEAPCAHLANEFVVGDFKDFDAVYNFGRTIQDKRIQKQFYKDHGIPTADFVLVDSRTALQEHVDFLPAFQKLGKGGYDGYGVQYMGGAADFENGYDAPSLLEKAVDFAKEISVITARNVHGDIAVFPAVEMVADPKLNLVDYLMSLGAPGYTGSAIYEGIDDVLAIDGTNVFLYGKAVTKPGRKMGHVTILGKDAVELKQKVDLVKQTIIVKA